MESRRLPALLERLAALEITDPKTINSTLEEFYSEPSSSPSNIADPTIRLALDDVFSLPTIPEIHARLQSLTIDESVKPEVKTWAKETLDMIEMRSPTSLVVALEAIKRARDGDCHASLGGCMKTELGVATAFCVSFGPPTIINQSIFFPP